VGISHPADTAPVPVLGLIEKQKKIKNQKKIKMTRSA
jgi:hypothetical protein